MSVTFALDMGIGSIGFAVVGGRADNIVLQESGVRTFPSGEIIENHKQSTKCRSRRTKRSIRRLERRRSFRKKQLKNLFFDIGLTTSSFEDELLDCVNLDVYQLKVKALDEMISPAELFKCLIHTCNHRGYRDFYDDDIISDEEESNEEGKNKKAVAELDKRFALSKKRTISEYLLSNYSDGNFVSFRNKTASGHDYLLIRRDLMQDEVEKILLSQSRYYSCLNEKNRAIAISIIFAQRDFEDGPGDSTDPFRRYRGYLASLGKCPFNPEEKRGFRCTVIADIFAVINTLSQYSFIDNRTGELGFDRNTAEAVIQHVLSNASATMTDIKALLKEHGYSLKKSDNSKESALSKSVKFLSVAKKCVESSGYSWNDWISEEQFNPDKPSKLHKISELLSTFQTPSRRQKELRKLTFLDDALIHSFQGKRNLSGTAKAGYRYMCDAIEAFLNGEIYGNYQERFRREHPDSLYAPSNGTFDKIPVSLINDEDVKGNPVVFRSVNEARKIVNALVERYGSPESLIIEVADELGRSFLERKLIQDEQSAHEKENDAIKAEIAKLQGYDDSKVTPVMVDKYKLYKQQEGKCIYSGEPLGDLRDVLSDPSHIYEVDHIVPYSLILDNTLSNKVLVIAKENQTKGQRTPLMFLTGKKREDFISTVKNMYTRDNSKEGKKAHKDYPPVNKKKLAYLMLDNLYSAEAKELLEDWKSRNINDTRYITKYVSGLFSKYLRFADPSKKNVYSVKGVVTSRFRRIWLKDTVWGENEKNRDSYLNHAIDAVILANLTPPYIEIASDGIKLRSIYYKNKKSTQSTEYREYFDSCVKKMEKYYHFVPSYTASLLSDPTKVPSFLPKLKEEVEIRFNDSDQKKFNRDVKKFYGSDVLFTVPPHMIITSRKQEKKFRGQIADDNPIRIVEIDGEPFKVSREYVTSLTSKKLPLLYGGDDDLIATLHRILDKQADKFTVMNYMEKHPKNYTLKNGDMRFVTDGGQPVRMVSLISDKKISNFYRKEISETNYSNLSGLSYYCVEVYKDKEGATRVRGIRFVDIVKKNKKLLIKDSTIPDGYDKHLMYLFKNDYIEVSDEKGKSKFEGFYQSVKSINENRFYFTACNNPQSFNKTIGIKDTVKKYYITLLGEKGGEIKCSAPLSLIQENESASRKDD